MKNPELGSEELAIYLKKYQKMNCYCIAVSSKIAVRLKSKYKALDYALSPIFCEERIKGRGKWLSWLVKGLEGAGLKDQRQSDLEKRYMDDAMGVGKKCKNLYIIREFQPECSHCRRGTKSLNGEDVSTPLLLVT